METLEQTTDPAQSADATKPEAGKCSGFFTIDSESTQDVDDALSIERLVDGVRIRVAIANASAHVMVGSTEDQEAQRRAATTYAGDRVLHRMLPRRISERAGSLVEGQLRKAVVFDIVLNNQLDVVSFTPAVTKIKVDRRLSYSDIPTIIESDSDPFKEHLSLAAHVSRMLLHARRKRGALAIYDLNMMLASDEEGNVKQFGSRAETIGYIIVQETMILVNAYAAAFLITHNIPGTFRNHEAKVAAPPSAEMASAIEQWFVEGRPDTEVIRARLSMVLGRARYAATCRGHYALSLNAYGHFTSPLRRYPDLVNQRQLVAHLRGKQLPYSQEQLVAMCADLNDAYDRRKQERSAGFTAAVMRTANKALAKGDLQHLADHEFCALIKMTPKGVLPQEVTHEIVRRAKAGSLTDRLVITLVFESVELQLSADVQAALIEWVDGYPGRPVSMCAIGERLGVFKSVRYQSAPAPVAQGFSSIATAEFANAKHEVVGHGKKKKDAEHAAALRLIAEKVGVVLPVSELPGDKTTIAPSPVSPQTADGNPKGALLEFCVKRHLSTPEFEITGAGPSHAPKFSCIASVTVYGKKLEVRVDDCATKKQAESRAATQLLALLNSATKKRSKPNPETSAPTDIVEQSAVACVESEPQSEIASKIDQAPHVSQAPMSKNPKGDLLEYCAKARLSAPVFSMQVSGPDHSPSFSGVATLDVEGRRLEVTVAGCLTKKQAEAQASAELMAQLVGLGSGVTVAAPSTPGLETLLRDAISNPNSVGALQEISQKLACRAPEYVVGQIPGKMVLFRCHLTTYHDGQRSFVAEGPSKQAAKTAAAKAALTDGATASA
jgi:ribonuclease R